MPIYALDGKEPAFADRDSNWIAPDAVLIGDVVVEANAGIWFGAVIRGDNEPIVIGADTNVQEHAVMHTDPGFPLTVGAGCTVGHRAVLHGCTIGDNSLIGMGAIVLNGARIGRNSLVGAGALVGAFGYDDLDASVLMIAGTGCFLINVLVIARHGVRGQWVQRITLTAWRPFQHPRTS